MVETGIVNSIDGNIVKMGCGPAEGCTSCSSSFCSAESRVFEAVNPKGLEIGTGDLVDVYLAPGKTAAAGFLVLVVPLILFATGYLVSGSLLPDSSEGVRALFGLLGLTAGFLSSFAYSSKRREQNMPVIVSIRKKVLEPAT
jgi:positive regulator of sigma E activity